MLVGRSRRWTLVHNFINGGLFITRSSHDVLVVRGNVTAEHWGRFFRLEWEKSLKFSVSGYDNLINKKNTYLEYTGTIRRSPSVQEIVFAGGHEPLAACCETKGEHTTFVQMQLIFVGLGRVKHFYVRVFHSNCQPVAY